MHINDNLHLRERVHGVVRFAEWGLALLGCLLYPLVLLIGGVVSVLGFRVSAWIGLLALLLSLWLMHNMHKKQRETRDLLERVDAVVQGSAQQLKEFLHRLVDQLLSTIAHAFSILPGLLLVVVILLAMSHHGGAGVVVLFFLVTTLALGCCLYGITHRLIWKQVGSLVDAIMETGSSQQDETSRLL